MGSDAFRAGNVAGDSNVDIRVRSEVGLAVYLLTCSRTLPEIVSVRNRVCCVSKASAHPITPLRAASDAKRCRRHPIDFILL